MFFGTGALKNFAMLEFLFNKVAGLQICSFIKKRLQHWCFSMKFAKSLRASFLQNNSGGCFWKYLITVFIAYENDESCHRGGTYCLSSAYFVLLRVLRSFLFLSFYFCCFFMDFTSCLGIEVSLSILKIKQRSCS